ncbi:DUF6491 family protein [Sphingomonas sp.]|uniref:DUF6491 family protein n=1 Tax=Sphingomonas sp. TaxID=28214 RepID=UPI001DF068EC|nr:DUF6491 family protein [Sphingomonas sp.]MBX9797228.1 hypothetical protein [Sphingomonas sp.]
MRKRRLILGAAAALLAGAATAAVTLDDPPPPSPALLKAVEGRVAGKPENCIEQTRVNGPEPVDQRHLLYRQSGKRVWINTLRGFCPPLVNDFLLVFDNQYGVQLCRNDRFQVATRNGGVSFAYCFLGSFTPYDKVPVPKG